MKQILQHLKTGRIEVAEVPCPMLRSGHLLVQTTRSVISAGTERMLVEFGQAGFIGKARSQPEKVRQVLDKVRTDGLLPTLEVVFSRLDEPLPLGYCNVGRVVQVGDGVDGFAVGDRVVSNGPHAEMVCVPSNLAARIPDDVDDETAAFTVLGSIALHGVRLLEPTYGECFAVVGLGLLGLMGVQFLRASGCEVLGIDLSVERCHLAERFGATSLVLQEGTDPVQAALALSEGRGLDGALVTAATKSSLPMNQAARMCRKRGRVVSTGNVGLELERGPLYEKEIAVRVSCSYGPGRYDPHYEALNRDYPLPYVRWTVSRNYDAVLRGMSRGAVDVGPLISSRCSQAEAQQAYQTVLQDSGSLGVVLTYPEQAPPVERVVALPDTGTVAGSSAGSTEVKVGVIGVGNFSKLVLLPAIARTKATIAAVASVTGVTGLHAARRFGSPKATSDYRELLTSSEVNTVFIATPHQTHASMVVEALEAGKHVFVEKPLAIDDDGLSRVRDAHRAHPELHLMVGFNRRFSPHTDDVRRLIAGRSAPIAVSLLVNAGDIPADSPHHDLQLGGGRIVGEGCHFIDLMLNLVGQPIASVQAAMFGPQAAGVRDDKMSITLTFADGSIGTLNYWANGSKAYPKERVEVFSEGRVAVIDNWRRVQRYGWRKKPALPDLLAGQDKGHRSEVAQFVERIAAGGSALIPFSELEQVTRASFAAMRSAREGIVVTL